MSDEYTLTNMAQARREELSPTLNQIDADAAAAEQEARAEAQKRLPEWTRSPDWFTEQTGVEAPEELTPEQSIEADTKKEKDDLEADDSFLPFATDVQDRYDMPAQQMADEAAGASRREGTYSNEHLLEGRSTLLGYDIANGDRLRDRIDIDQPGVSDSLNQALRNMHGAKLNVRDGYDKKGLSGGAQAAAAIAQAGGTPEQIEEELSALNMPRQQIKMAAKAADNAILEADLAQAYHQDVTLEEAREAAMATPPPSIEREDLITHEQWLQSARALYQMEEGTPFPGDDVALSDWAVKQMAAFNWRILPGPDVASMAYYSRQAYSRGGDYAKALYNMMVIYDQVDTDTQIFMESLKAAITDVSLLVGGFGAGKLVTTIGQRVAKNRMKKWLQRVIANAAVGGVEGAVYATGEEAMRQTVAIAAEAQDGYDLGDLGKAGAVGTAAGVTLGVGFGEALSPYALDYYRKVGRQVRDNYRTHRPPGPYRGQLGAIGDMSKLGLFAGQKDRMGTRVPTSPDATEDPLTDNIQVGVKSLGMSDALEKNVAKMEAYDALRAHPDPNATVEERAQYLIDQMKDNLLWLHDQMKPELRARARQWYDGARKQVDRWAEEYDLEPSQVAAVIAALSPQMPWFQNMSQAERVMDIWTNYQNFKPNEVMVNEGDRIYLSTKPKKDWNSNDKVKAAVWGDIQNKALSELNTDYERAMWIRAFDQSNNPRSHRVWTPEGEMVGFDTTKSGSLATVSWGSLDSIGSAVSALEDGSRQNLSNVIGGMHKVRNFYNNIVAPKSDLGEVTIDTHAVAAALMQPHGGSAQEVLDNLGAGAGSNLTGDTGTYGIIADAYRQAAAERGILPREMQSITWEEIRTIFDNKSQGVKDATQAVWKEYKSGTIDQDTARSKVDDIAREASKSESRDPSWAGRGSEFDEETFSASYDKELPRDGVPRGDTAPVTRDPGELAQRVEGERARRRILRGGVYAVDRPRYTGDAASRVYRGRSPGGDRGLRGVAQVFDLKKGGKAATYNNTLRKTDLPTNPVYHELKPEEMASTFQAALAESKANSPYGASVTVYSPEEYAGMRLFQSPDGSAGFAIKPDGDIVSVYSAGGGHVYSMLQLAVEQGGTKLDAFDTVLPDMYGQAGFKEDDRLTWSDEYTPDDWDFDTFAKYNKGRPDVVMMVYDPKFTPKEK